VAAETTDVVDSTLLLKISKKQSGIGETIPGHSRGSDCVSIAPEITTQLLSLVSEPFNFGPTVPPHMGISA
jgi:hypothetical protein